MDSLEAWLDFRRGEQSDEPRKVYCIWCGELCSGDTTDDETGDPICDNQDECIVRTKE